ncbi:ribonucleoside-triphosphate reductase, adenosylcobalamin-dependent [Kitasatospora sp. NPDC056184]|uniref:ribonucleoside-triphosphate reductase, adenosylcobalamin-dependent n=1 Tax=Kitasatospora sp. NPDC056184 TaxID=3345738 RepID=UPI0035E02D18
MHFPHQTGQDVYERTYSRKKPDGTREEWPETVTRVVDGNLKLNSAHLLEGERERLIDMMTGFKILPAGRHLWASGVKGRQYLFNCHVSGWSSTPAEHFDFTFMRLMEGGGVGANYSNRHLDGYGLVQREHEVHIVCDPAHQDYEEMQAAGLISGTYDPDWDGAFEVEDSREGWSAALVDLMGTYYSADVQHRNRVYDVSRVRAAGARLKTFGGTASGPGPLARMLREVQAVMNEVAGRPNAKMLGLDAMAIDHAIAECVVSGGVRRSARMAIMRWDDKQIGEFLDCKRDFTRHWTTNISVEVDNAFFRALAEGDQAATATLRRISEGMIANGEPGIWNSEYANQGEPNPVIATNPCGEIGLEAWENCNLGHVNLAAFVDEAGRLDKAGLMVAHRLMTRFLIRATYGDVNDPKQAATLARNRRIGVGHLGLAGMLAKLGIRYSDAPHHPEIIALLEDMAAVVDEEADCYSHDLRIPRPVKTRTVAPTGTIAKLVGVSEGIHAIFAPYFLRRIRFSTVDEDQAKQLAEYQRLGFHVEPCQYAQNTAVVTIPTKDSLLAEVEQIHGPEAAQVIVQSASDLTPAEMLSVQLLYQEHWADNAVSYTVNVRPERYSALQVADLIREFGPVLKGTTVFPEQSRPQSPYERITQAEYEQAAVRAVADGVDEECSSGACPVR